MINITEQQFLNELKSRYGDWALPTLEANNALVEAEDTREIGKSRQHSAELLIVNWLNSLSLGLNVKTQKELHEIENISEVLPEFDHNESGFDAYCLNTNKKFQIKYRGGQTIHMEQTRRSSEKNKGAASSTGHVVYSHGEFDVLVVVRPEDISNSFDPSKDILVISESDLRDPKNPGFLVRGLGKKEEKRIKSLIKEQGAEKVLKELLK
jgi:hypothetical protein